MPKPGGPCCICGTTLSSTWYGKSGTAENPGLKYCRSNKCKEKGGYQTKKKRKRGRARDDDSECSMAISSCSVLKVSDVKACLGMRFARACLVACFALPRVVV